jgi:hypothetical protein
MCTILFSCFSRLLFGQYHFYRDQEQRDAKYLLQQDIGDIRGYLRAQQTADEKPQADVTGNTQIL